MTRNLEKMTMSENGYCFNPETGAAFVTNRTGLAILRALKSASISGVAATNATQGGVKEIVAGIAAAFAAPAVVVERDLLDFMDLLRAKGVFA